MQSLSSVTSPAKPHFTSQVTRNLRKIQHRNSSVQYSKIHPTSVKAFLKNTQISLNIGKVNFYFLRTVILLWAASSFLMENSHWLYWDFLSWNELFILLWIPNQSGFLIHNVFNQNLSPNLMKNRVAKVFQHKIGNSIHFQKQSSHA